MPDFHQLLDEFRQRRGVATDDDDQRERREERLQTYRRRMHDSGLPDGWWNCSLKKWKPEWGNPHAIEAAKNSLGSKRGLVFTGPRGIRKTVLLADIVRAYCSRNAQPIYIHGVALAKRIEDQRFGENIVAELLSYPVIVIDDLTFKTSPHSYVCDIYNLLIDGIYSRFYGLHPLQLYIATNHPVIKPEPSLRSIFSDSFTSRLLEICSIVPMTGPDGRLSHAEIINP